MFKAKRLSTDTGRKAYYDNYNKQQSISTLTFGFESEIFRQMPAFVIAS